MIQNKSLPATTQVDQGHNDEKDRDPDGIVDAFSPVINKNGGS
jgi:hypothetical protein